MGILTAIGITYFGLFGIWACGRRREPRQALSGLWMLLMSSCLALMTNFEFFNHVPLWQGLLQAGGFLLLYYSSFFLIWSLYEKWAWAKFRL